MHLLIRSYLISYRKNLEQETTDVLKKKNDGVYWIASSKLLYLDIGVSVSGLSFCKDRGVLRTVLNVCDGAF